MIVKFNRGQSMPPEILSFVNRVYANKEIQFGLNEYNNKDDGAIGKKIEEVHLEPGTVHGECAPDIPGLLELKSKNISAKSNDINIAFISDPVDMVIRVYDKIKDRIGLEEYEFDKETNRIIVKRFVIYENLSYENFIAGVRFNNRSRKGWSFDVNKNKLSQMYEKTIIVFDDINGGYQPNLF
jgi:hypothetical protein